MLMMQKLWRSLKKPFAIKGGGNHSLRNQGQRDVARRHNIDIDLRLEKSKAHQHKVFKTNKVDVIKKDI